jgi:hypothetical protein
MQTDTEKAAEILKKRRLAAKGLKERKDGKPIDPMTAMTSLAIDKDPEEPETPVEKEEEIAMRAFAIGLGMRRN